MANLTDNGLWIAQYADDNNMGWEDTPWNTISVRHIMHQYTSKGRIYGWNKDLDLSLFYGDVNTWLAYAGATGQPIPTTQPQAQTYTQQVQNDGTTYIVQSGDTLSGIASMYGTTYQHLAEINGIANPNLIHVGQEIRIDGTAPNNKLKNTTQSKVEIHYLGIADKFGTTWQWLAEVNGIANPNLIYPGNTIRCSIGR